jgi:hypothetical protein
MLAIRREATAFFRRSRSLLHGFVFEASFN